MTLLLTREFIIGGEFKIVIGEKVNECEFPKINLEFDSHIGINCGL
ncbi:hypothetical protein SPLC1_S103090 [Arthrospira platensis C1]|nr:hypothetical protein SPLC1_S103090 [Arthrospira platensis C1]